MAAKKPRWETPRISSSLHSILMTWGSVYIEDISCPFLIRSINSSFFHYISIHEDISVFCISSVFFQSREHLSGGSDSEDHSLRSDPLHCQQNDTAAYIRFGVDMAL